MKEITDSTEKISKIIRVIDEIAFQANILALNAALEAAGANEAEPGLDVVSEDGSKLASAVAGQEELANHASTLSALLERLCTKVRRDHGEARF
jgi:methyl-accepting chemotaxis protein-like sensor